VEYENTVPLEGKGLWYYGIMVLRYWEGIRPARMTRSDGEQ